VRIDCVRANARVVLSFRRKLTGAILLCTQAVISYRLKQIKYDFDAFNILIVTF